VVEKFGNRSTEGGFDLRGQLLPGGGVRSPLQPRHSRLDPLRGGAVEVGQDLPHLHGHPFHLIELVDEGFPPPGVGHLGAHDSPPRPGDHGRTNHTGEMGRAS
jgi:hypothetical protein